MADIQYKKGELLLNETFETSKPDEQYSFNVATKDISTDIIEDIVIIDFNGIEYTCINLAPPITQETVYGGYTEQGADFTEYPFAFGFIEEEEQKIVSLLTPDSGTYTVKVYAAVEDTDSAPLSPTDFIIAYLMKSPQNSNWNVLSTLLGDGDWSRLKTYVETTPKNMNRQVLKALLGSGSSGSSAVVGTAVVGRDIVG